MSYLTSTLNFSYRQNEFAGCWLTCASLLALSLIYVRSISVLFNKLCWHHRRRRRRHVHPLIFHANECNKTISRWRWRHSNPRTVKNAHGNSNPRLLRARTCTEEMGFLSITNLRQPSGPCPDGASLSGDVTIGYVHNGSPRYQSQ